MFTPPRAAVRRGLHEEQAPCPLRRANRRGVLWWVGFGAYISVVGTGQPGLGRAFQAPPTTRGGRMSTTESSPTMVQGMFVGGAWRPSASGETFEATSPGTGEVIGAIPQGDRADAQAAVAAAAQAFPGWAAQTAFAPAAALHRIADVCERRREELARALTLDQGKPLHAESYDEVDELLAMWRGAAEDGVRLEGSIPASASPGKRVLLMRRPLGPVAVVTPWNWPYTMPAESVAPALPAGNTGVWTPAPSTALCSALLAECVAEAHLPPGVFNFVTGPGAIVGDELVANPGP